MIERWRQIKKKERKAKWQKSYAEHVNFHGEQKEVNLCATIWKYLDTPEDVTRRIVSNIKEESVL